MKLEVDNNPEKGKKAILCSNCGDPAIEKNILYIKNDIYWACCGKCCLKCSRYTLCFSS